MAWKLMESDLFGVYATIEMNGKVMSIREELQDEEVLRELAKSSSDWVLVEVALNPCTPADALDFLAKTSNSMHIVLTVAGNPNTSLETLEILAKNPIAVIRDYVASNPNTSVNLLEYLAGDVSDFVLEKVAGNINTPSHVLTQLAGCSFYRVSREVAKNPNTPIEILWKLSENEDAAVRSCIGDNPNISTELLVKLSKDNEFEVVAIAARSTKMPVNILEELAEHYHHTVRASVASNPATPVEILETFIKDDRLVKNCLAENLSATPGILRELAEIAENRDLVVQLVCNPATPSDLLERFYVSEFHDDFVVSLIAENYNTPIKCLKEMAKNKSWLVRANVAKNPATDSEILLDLYADENEEVSQAVYERIGGSSFEDYINYWAEENKSQPLNNPS